MPPTHQSHSQRRQSRAISLLRTFLWLTPAPCLFLLTFQLFPLLEAHVPLAVSLGICFLLLFAFALFDALLAHGSIHDGKIDRTILVSHTYMFLVFQIFFLPLSLIPIGLIYMLG